MTTTGTFIKTITIRNKVEYTFEVVSLYEMDKKYLNIIKVADDEIIYIKECDLSRKSDKIVARVDYWIIPLRKHNRIVVKRITSTY